MLFATMVYCAATGLYLAARRSLSIIDVAYIYLSVQFVSVVINGLQDQGNYLPATIFASGLLAMSLGLAIVGKKVIVFDKVHGTENRVCKELTPRAFLLLFVLVTLAIIYHYVVGGIPLLSSAITTERFEHTRSGLFGIPGRLAMYGPAFLLFLLSALAAKTIRAHGRLFLGCIAVVGSVSLVLNGNKGALLEIVQILLICFWYAQAKNTRLVRLGDVTVFFAAAVGIVFVVAAFQLAVHQSAVDVEVRLIERVFLLSGMPFYYLVNTFMPVHEFGYGQYITSDIGYLLSRIVAPQSDINNISQLVSASIHGRDIGSDFIVPITLTVFGQFYADFGVLGVLFGGLLFGALFALVMNSTYRAKTAMGAAVLMFQQLIFFMAATKGNAFFAFASGWFALVFLYILYRLARALGGQRPIRK